MGQVYTWSHQRCVRPSRFTLVAQHSCTAAVRLTSIGAVVCDFPFAGTVSNAATGAGANAVVVSSGCFPSLQCLHLGSSCLGTKALQELTQLSRLTHLTLESEQHLSQPLVLQLLTSIGTCNLEGLRIRGCPGVTREGLGQLVRSCSRSITQVGGSSD